MSIFFAAPIDQHPNYDKVTSVPTSAHALSGFPAANLLTYDPTQVFAANQAVPIILWDFGVAKDFDVISLIHTNLTDAATIRIEASNDGVSYTDLQASGTAALAHIVAGQTVQNRKNMLSRNLTLYNSAVNRNYRFLRITPNSQGGPNPTIGRLFVGKKFVPSTGWQYGSQLGFTDLSKHERTDRSALILDSQPSIRTANVKLDFLSKTEMYDSVWEFNYWRGSGREFLACLDAEDTKYLQKNTLYCTISEGRQISFDAYNTHSSNWTLENIAAA